MWRSRRMRRHLNVFRDRQRQFAGSEAQERDLTLEFSPVLLAFRTSEHEIVVYEPGARIPSLADRPGGPDRKAGVFLLDLLPVRRLWRCAHHQAISGCKCARQNRNDVSDRM